MYFRKTLYFSYFILYLQDDPVLYTFDACIGLTLNASGVAVLIDLALKVLILVAYGSGNGALLASSRDSFLKLNNIFIQIN